jgi:hypothetical protein
VISLESLRARLARLTWDAARQRAYLAELGVAPLADELALEFDDVYRVAAIVEAGGDIPPTAIDALVEVDRLLTELSHTRDGQAAWHSDALSSARWNEIREAARHAYAMLFPDDI